MKKIKKSCTVKIISGYYKGKTGKVINIFPKINKLQIKNMGYAKKHIKPGVRKNTPKGGVISLPKYIHISNVLFLK